MQFSFVFLIFVISGSSWHVSDARWICSPCTTVEECKKEPVEFCMWGETRDYCERRTCAKGPGERCGGPFLVLGRCGEGTVCKADQRCHGCSTTTLQCYA